MNLFTYNLLGLKPKAFGLEIENCSIKAVWLEKKRRNFRLVSCGKKNIPRGIVQSEQVIDPKKLADEIKNLLGLAQPKPIKLKNVVFSIPETKAFIRTIQIPKMSLKEAREAVKWETEANIPISVDKVYLDWQVIADKGNEEEILVVAVPKNIVDPYFEAANLAGLAPLAVEVDAMATIRSLTGSLENDQPILIADIGAENTSLAISQNQIPYFTSSIPLSGNSFTEALQKEIGVSWEKAEEIKFKFGCGKMSGEDMLNKIFNPLVENLASEIEKSINFFAESINSRDKVKKVIICGGGALLHDFSNYLGKRLKTEVDMGDPSHQIDVSSFPYKITPRDLLSYSTAVGLALRGADYEN
ncbi:MAG TPA: type IV pilus assembly protein PilM [Candidatus Bathyarchaeia archaeon]|nr:type IV pilus assembly protein PilM [Candidatus Bathyarchaeia archaeon]